MADIRSGWELLAEYPANSAANQPTKEYGYRNGQLLISAEAGNASAPAAFADDFNDNSLNANSWSVYYPGTSPTVSEQSQQLQITLSPNTAAADANGVKTMAYFARGSSEKVLKVARKWLGDKNVKIFDDVK